MLAVEMRKHGQPRLRAVKPWALALDLPPVRRSGDVIGYTGDIGKAVLLHARLTKGLCMMVAHAVKRAAPLLAGKQAAQLRRGKPTCPRRGASRQR